MFEVAGKPILATGIDILNDLKLQLRLHGIDRFNKIKQSNYNVQFCCPFHKDKNGIEGGEKNPSAGMLLEDKGDAKAGTVNCFSCSYTAPIQIFISNCFGYDDQGAFGTKWLFKNYVSIEIENRPMLQMLPLSRKVAAKEKPIYISEEELDSYRYYHEYMAKRKLTMPIIEKFDVGYIEAEKCVTFPCHDKEGNCLFIAKRSVNTKFFHYPEGVSKPVYGLHHITQDIRTVIVCESIINALTCEVYGKHAIALIGTGNSAQYDTLNKSHIRKFIMALDPDDAGRKATLRFRKNISRAKIITEFVMPEGRDINDLTQEEFNNLKEIY